MRLVIVNFPNGARVTLWEDNPRIDEYIRLAAQGGDPTPNPPASEQRNPPASEQREHHGGRVIVMRVAA